MWLDIFITAIIYASIAGVFASIFHAYFNRKFIGGFWGAFGIGFVGSAIGAFALDVIFCKISALLEKGIVVLNWLMRNSDHEIMPPVNIVAAVAGAVLLILIFKKMTPN